MTRFAWFLGVFAAVGCADVSDDGPTSAVLLPARWALSEVEDRALPATVPAEGGVSREVLSGRLTLAGDGTWTYRYDRHDTGEGVDRMESSGATGLYEMSAGAGLTLRLTELGGRARYTATVRSDVLDVEMNGQHLRFQRDE